MDTESRSITEMMADLADADTVAGTEVAELAGLNRNELDSFTGAWQSIAITRRREIVSRMVDLAEEDIDLNFDSIFRFCLGDPDPEVRSKAIDGLWENEETSLIEPLLDMLANDDSERVQAAAAAALGRFTTLGEQGRLRKALLTRLQGELQHALNDDSRPDEVRRRALESLAPLSTSEVTSAIREAYEGQNPRLKVSALYAMGKNCDPAWLPALVGELDNTDAEMRFEAAKALGELGEEDAVPHLVEHGTDPDTEVQMAVLEALGKIGGRKAKEYLQSCLNSRSHAIRDAAAAALEELRATDDPLSLRL